MKKTSKESIIPALVAIVALTGGILHLLDINADYLWVITGLLTFIWLLTLDNKVAELEKQIQQLKEG